MAVNEKEVYQDYQFSFKLKATTEGANKVLFKLAEFLESKDWATYQIKALRA